MVFAPFTGYDNHYKTVTFGCSLLIKEDVDSYIWLFQQFKNTMAYEPDVIVTDQDPAMRVAFDRVFTIDRHRWCMWHIMEKVSLKVSSTHLNLPGYRKFLGKIIWNDQLTVEEFERGWCEFITKYDEQDNKWFKDMYDLREYWILAYFRHILLGGLFRTTSISESQNSFFNKYFNKNFSLVEQYMHFESAMEKQRYVQLKNDVDSYSKKHDVKTPLLLEKHAPDTYILKLFKKVQTEIEDSIYYCSITDVFKDDGHISYTIQEGMDEYSVQLRQIDGHSICTCNMFFRIVIPCSHIFTCLKASGFEEIPNSLILARWRKGANRFFSCEDMDNVFKLSANIDRTSSLVSEIWTVVQNCIGLSDGNQPRLNMMLQTISELKTSFTEQDKVQEVCRTKKQDAKDYAGIDIPKHVEIRPPFQTRNKGCGSGGRMKSGKENSMAEKKKIAEAGKRKCKKCGEATGHDSRNCHKFKKC